MNYPEAVAYIESFIDYEKSPATLYAPARFDLRRMEHLLNRLENPHRWGHIVHIAGTKGKGSTAAMIAAVLTAAGYSTGLFTSPHLHNLRERIRIDGEPIPEVELAALVTRLHSCLEAQREDTTYGSLTYFEVLTALAFAYFRGKGAQFQVIETGLGGRLDATNVVEPNVCVITAISLDHTAILGDTFSQIAAEKAGIIKPGIPIVSAPQTSEAATVIKNRCSELNAPLTMVGEDITWQLLSADMEGQSFQMKGNIAQYELWLPLLGRHQLENAAAVVAALEILQSQGITLAPTAMADGLSQVRWRGRLEILQRSPLVVADGAHNAHSARRLKEALLEYLDFDRLILIIGTSSDKDIEGIVKELSPLADEVMVSRSQHPRAANPELLAEAFTKLGLTAQVRENVAQALTQALAQAEERDLICITGSLFIVAEAIQCRDASPRLARQS
ncbi:MAG: bifunctional folylpolyglutamate synthase/dihydrofolate synthase [Chloroflexi bacterium]|nr:bifunctional folylpolyglutamate synthase/dihydrofolate synthase [Chloroflexota bacterium]